MWHYCVMFTIHRCRRRCIVVDKVVVFLFWTYNNSSVLCILRICTQIDGLSASSSWQRHVNIQDIRSRIRESKSSLFRFTKLTPQRVHYVYSELFKFNINVSRICIWWYIGIQASFLVLYTFDEFYLLIRSRFFVILRRYIIIIRFLTDKQTIINAFVQINKFCKIVVKK